MPRGVLLGVAVVAGVVLIMGLFLVGLAAKERDNRFCVGCHLHDEKYARYLAAPPVDLSGAHRRADASVGCIACHGGADAPMRLRVWTLAAFDTLRFLAGTYAEPERMRLPLRDAECGHCHTPITKPSAPVSPPRDQAPAGNPGEAISQTEPPPDVEPPAFHRLRAHEIIRVTCARCHASHAVGGTAAARFLVPAIVEPVCRECHPSL
jgi:hypothetical protein